MSAEPTVLIVPGLRDHVAQHWQTLLTKQLPWVLAVPPMGRDELGLQARVDAIERTAREADGPLVIVAHSGGCIMVAHWARQTRIPVRGALLATPPDFERPMPEGYPTLDALHEAGWLPVPREPLPFPSIAAISRNDPLGSYVRVTALAHGWRSRIVDIGEVGHLNPASGYGPWPQAKSLIDALSHPAPASQPATTH